MFLEWTCPPARNSESILAIRRQTQKNNFRRIITLVDGIRAVATYTLVYNYSGVYKGTVPGPFLSTNILSVARCEQPFISEGCASKAVLETDLICFFSTQPFRLIAGLAMRFLLQKFPCLGICLCKTRF